VSVPYNDLHIYLVNGQVEKEEESYMGERFLGNWVEDGNSFLFFSYPAHKEMGLLLRVRPDLTIIDNFHFTYEQWQGGGLDVLKVDEFIIMPPWLEIEVRRENIKILLDPGLVFGNGLHPTTRDCLRAISLTHKQRPFKKVLDLGTGTGVLALAACSLGAEHVVAVDLNPLCSETARKNVKLNNIEETIEIVTAKAEEYTEFDADLVIANIHFPVIREFLDLREFKQKDRFIISGLMRSQAREAADLLKKEDFHFLKKWEKDMTWFTFLAEKK
jgi:ribosomal protein L11 methyltransferase